MRDVYLVFKLYLEIIEQSKKIFMIFLQTLLAIISEITGVVNMKLLREGITVNAKEVLETQRRRKQPVLVL